MSSLNIMSSLNPSPSTNRKSPSSIKTTKKVKRLKLKTKPPSSNRTDNTNTDTREKANIIIENVNDKELTINHDEMESTANTLDDNKPNSTITQDNKKQPKKTKKQLLVDKIFKPNELGISVWIERSEWEGTGLDWGNNGDGRNGIYFGDKRFNWEVKRGKNRKVIALRTTGFNDDLLRNASRPIRQDIRKHHIKTGCVVCGSNSDLIIDHKNDSYNDMRVLIAKTQTIDDFQCLCNHCNLQKRQVYKNTKATNKRFGATNIPSLAPYNIDFIKGDETYNPEHINPMDGTYWHDPIEFHKYIASFILSNKID